MELPILKVNINSEEFEVLKRGQKAVQLTIDSCRDVRSSIRCHLGGVETVDRQYMSRPGWGVESRLVQLCKLNKLQILLASKYLHKNTLRALGRYEQKLCTIDTYIILVHFISMEKIKIANTQWNLLESFMSFLYLSVFCHDERKSLPELPISFCKGRGFLYVIFMYFYVKLIP